MTPLELKIFISSPGDVAQERKRAAAVIERLQDEFRYDARLLPYFWEDAPLEASKSFQPQIARASKFDLAVFCFWSRLGTPLRVHGKSFSSGTAFEFQSARRSNERKRRPGILAYFKEAKAYGELDDEKLSEARDQVKALKQFRNEWFGAPGETPKAASHSFETPDQFERLLETHLRRWIREQVRRSGRGPVSELPWPESKGSPWPGLKPYDVEHARVFYGREHAVKEIVAGLRAQAEAGCAFLLIFGMSGCGKSSVVRAGVLPKLVAGAGDPESGLWRRAILRPGDPVGNREPGQAEIAGDPCSVLARAFFTQDALPELARGGVTPEDLGAAFREAPAHALPPLRMALQRAAEAARAKKGLDLVPRARLVLLVDQFEDLFALERIKPHEREAFVAALDALARSGLVWVVATMRSDYYARCTELRTLDALKKGQGQYDLLPPTFPEIGQMIRLPARDAGLVFEDNEDTHTSLADVLHEAAARDPDSLPLLAFTLERLYRKRAESDRMLTLRTYDELGGLEGALGKYAADVLSQIDPSVQAVLPGLFPALVALGAAQAERPTAVRVALAQVESTPQRKELVEALIKARLLVADRTGDGQAVVGFVHEALLRHWARLRDWIEADRDFLRTRTRVTHTAARWRQEGRNADFLLAEGKPLAEARDLLAKRRSDLDFDVVEFVEASVKHGRRKRQRRILLAVAAAAAILVALAAVSYNFYESRVRNERLEAQRLTAANGRVEALATAEVRSIPGIIKELGDDRRLVRKGLARMAAGESPAATPRGRLPAALALLPVEPAQAAFLSQRLLDPEAGPEEVIVIRDALMQHRAGDRIAAAWRDMLEGTPTELTDTQFRAAAALAKIHPNASIWFGLAEPIARKLVQENSLLLGTWRELFQPIAVRLNEPLRAIYANLAAPDSRDRAFTLLFEFATWPRNPNQAEDLTALIGDADSSRFHQVLRKLETASNRAPAIAWLSQRIQDPARFDDALARRQGRWAMALLELKQPEPVWPLFRHRDDPSLRTELIHNLARFG
ncbi:MAG TPA: hypothetical protein VGY53_08500, partial [Isosphaeraceae bacterium]|nr:hypothetical protein [Isosphaeraceae bacterium]